MENNKVLTDTALHIRGIDSLDGNFSKDDLINSMFLQQKFFSDEVLSIRKQLDYICFCLPDESAFKDTVFKLQQVSCRLSNLYSKTYHNLCK